MSLEAELVTVLKAVSPHVYAGFAKTSTPRPYIIFQQIGGDVIVSLSNQLGDLENAFMQIDVWADSHSAAKAAIRQIEAALVSSSVLTARPLSAPSSDYDADMERYSSRQDFSIWAAR